MLWDASRAGHTTEYEARMGHSLFLFLLTKVVGYGGNTKQTRSND
jgi:hypothetical protein